MKGKIFLMTLAFMSMVLCSASSCNEDNDNNHTNNNNMEGTEINIKVNTQIFTATLLDNNTAKAFKKMLPLTINMIELNGNEKYFDLTNNVPINSSNPQTIKNGDLMLYGSKTLVLFYKTFATSYSYTRLGAVSDTTGLATALGSGNVTVTFEAD